MDENNIDLFIKSYCEINKNIIYYNNTYIKYKIESLNTVFQITIGKASGMSYNIPHWISGDNITVYVGNITESRLLELLDDEILYLYMKIYLNKIDFYIIFIGII